MRSFSKGYYQLNIPQKIILTRLMNSIGFATLVTITSLYFDSLGLSFSQIGIVTAISYMLSFIIALLLPPLLERFNLEKLLVFSIAIFSLNLIVMGSIPSAALAVVLFFSARTMLVLIDTTASILFKDDNPTIKSFRKNTALLGSVSSLAWTITPLVAGFLIEARSFSFVYGLAGSIVMLGAVFLFLNPVPVKDKKRKEIDSSLVKNIKFYLSSRHLRDSYIMSMGTNIWWGFIFTFVALFMTTEGYSTSSIGIFITLTQAPLFLLEFKTDMVVSKFGFRIPFTVSYLLLASTGIYGFFYGITTALLVILVIASITMAYIEPAREMYVYSGLDSRDEEKAYPIFSTATIFGSIIVRLLVSLVLLTLDYRYSFLVIVVLMLYISQRAYRITEK